MIVDNIRLPDKKPEPPKAAWPKDGNPVFVFVSKARAPQVADYGGSFRVTSGAFSPQMVGMIADPELFVPDGLRTNEKLEAALGRPPILMISEIAGLPGYGGAMGQYAHVVETMDEAKTLPGFVMFGMWTGYNYMLPPKYDENQIDDRNGVLKFKLAEPLSPPPYGKDGAYVQSMIPMGQIAKIVLLREDSEHLYCDIGLREPEADVKTAMRVRRLYGLAPPAAPQ